MFEALQSISDFINTTIPDWWHFIMNAQFMGLAGETLAHRCRCIRSLAGPFLSSEGLAGAALVGIAGAWFGYAKGRKSKGRLMRYTLLELTQDVLSSLDGEEVTSINDTTESTQIVKIIKSCLR